MRGYLNNLLLRVDFLFPEQKIFRRKYSLPELAAFFTLTALVFYGVGLFIPADGFIGYDWVHVFSQGRFPPFYPPWSLVVSRLNWPLLVGLSMAGIVLGTFLRSVHPISTVAALLSLPVLWTLFLGQLDGLVVLGLLGLPYLTPLALIKPQVSLFAFTAKKSYLFAFLIWFGISLVVWGWWPGRMLAVNTYYAEGRYHQDIAIGYPGILLALPMLWFSRGDMDMLMISGAFVTPHLIPYNMIPFTPAIARLRPGQALIACVFSWLPLSANWLGIYGWWLGWLMALWLWSLLALQRYRMSKIQVSAE